MTVLEEGGVGSEASTSGFEVLFTANPLPMWIFDETTLRFLAVNDAAVAGYGWSREELLGMTILDIRPAEDAEAVRHAVAAQPDGRQPPRRWRHLRADGSVFDVDIAAHRVRIAGRAAMFVLAQDVSEQLRMEHALAHAATHDPLTGLANRTLLDRELDATVAPGGLGVAVFMIDLDRFKDINDTLGHAAGDELLAVLARRLVEEVRPGDTVARFGGDEFVVCCPGLSDPDGAVALAERLQLRLSEPVEIRGMPFSPAAAVGVAVVAAHAPVTAEALIRDADAAMYQAKAVGGGTVRLYDDQLRQRNVARLELEHELRRVLREGGLELAYQPVCNLESRVVSGVEALLRWSHPTLGEVPPREVVAVAERSGLIHELGGWVLREACGRVARWLDRWPEATIVRLAVNVSHLQLADEGFVEVVAAVLADTGLPAGLLSLEITEAAAMGEVDVVAERLLALRRLGVRLAIDDFGTGYSSLLHLKRFPLEALKIDRSFVDGLGIEPEDSAIVGATVSLATALGLHCVAEGIETEEQLAALVELGCRFGQGHLLARPLDASALEAMLTAADGAVRLDR